MQQPSIEDDVRDVFVSYSHSDVAAATRIAEAVDRAGFTVWIDRQLAVGDRWEPEIWRRVNQARAVVCCWSPSAAESDWVLREALAAHQAGTLLPVVLGETTVHKAFSDVQALHFADSEGSLSELLQAISARVGRPQLNGPLSWKADPLADFEKLGEIRFRGWTVNERFYPGQKATSHQFGLRCGSAQIQCVRWRVAPEDCANESRLVDVSGKVQINSRTGAFELSVNQLTAVPVEPPPNDPVLAAAKFLAEVNLRRGRPSELGERVSRLAHDPGIGGESAGTSQLPLDSSARDVVARQIRDGAHLAIGILVSQNYEKTTRMLVYRTIEVQRSASVPSGFEFRWAESTPQWVTTTLSEIFEEEESTRISETTANEPFETALSNVRVAIGGSKKARSRGCTSGDVDEIWLVALKPAVLVKSIARDLASIGGSSPEARNESVLGFLLGPVAERQPRLVHPKPMLLQGTLDHDRILAEVLQTSRPAPVVLVQGPPGTGKTQMLLNVCAAAIACRLRVVVASTNNHAVDGLSERMGLGHSPLVRVGPRDLDVQARAQVAALFENLPDESELRRELVRTQPGWEAETASWASDYADLNRLDELELLQIRHQCQLALLHKQLALVVGVGEDEVRSVVDVLTQVRSLRGSAILPPKWRRVRRLRARRNLRRGERYLFASVPMGNLPSENAFTLLGQIEGETRALASVASQIETMPTRSELEDRISAGDWTGRHFRTAGYAAALCRYGAYSSSMLMSEGTRKQLDELRNAWSTHRVHESVPAIATTFHSASRWLPADASSVDLLIIDEASQVGLVESAPLLARARRALIIGDPQQLAAIDTLDADERMICRRWLSAQPEVDARIGDGASVWDVASRVIATENVHQLSDHFRCAPQIAEFINEKYYRGGMRIRTVAEDAPALRWEHVAAQAPVARDKRSSLAEAKRVRDIVNELEASGVGLCNIGIITPFTDQEIQIRRLLGPGRRSEPLVGTVHKFQGDERDFIIISLVLGDGAPDGRVKFVDDARMLNVSLSRARRQAIVVGNRNFWFARDGELSRLASFIGV